MEMKKFANAQMGEAELDFVVGGAGFSYIIKRKDGKYNVVTANRKLDVAEIKLLLNGGPIDSKLNKADPFIVRDVTDKQMSTVKKQLNAAYGGCKFQVIKI